jgi:acyl-CoA oxidase
MGRHGYLDSSGVGRLFADELASVTYEGENLMLNLQVVRAAIKAYETAASAGHRESLQVSPSTAYLGTLNDRLGFPELTTGHDWRAIDKQNRLLALRAALCVQRLSERRTRGEQAGSEEEWESGWKSQEVAKTVVESYMAWRLVKETTSPNGLLRRGLEERDRKVVNDSSRW